MKKIIIVIMSVVVLMACDNKTRQTESVVFDNQADVEQTKPDTVASSKQKEMPTVEEKQSKPISSSSASSSRSLKSNHDNMRGFDPASEDDMDDNGMSRYMENNDEEGWD
jgi:uncharacterized lipoprotein NlpE involved in copper resistance